LSALEGLPAFGELNLKEKAMSGTTHMNIILGQGNTIKEVHNVKKQNLEMNQQVVAQKSEDMKKEDKTKVQEFETKNRIEIKKEKEKKKDQKGNPKKSNNENQEEKRNLSEGKLIDIRV
jgi:NCAIR mutase (PurE)-related protein